MARGRRISDRQRARFLELLEECGVIAHAANASGIARQSLYRLRQRDEAFRAAWAEAEELGIGALEDECMRRALEGWEEPVFQQGKQVGTIRRYSDHLAMFILRAKRPHICGERHQGQPIRRSW